MVVSGPPTVLEHTVDIRSSYNTLYVQVSEILNIIGRLGTKHNVNNNAVRVSAVTQTVREAVNFM